MLQALKGVRQLHSSSMKQAGGNIAGLFSALYPEMVDAVVLLDSYGFLPTELVF
ncbi:Serine hydrolase-like protein [Larimichthys crocea]|uniref:Uncharacterized protein n=1 Tax=Larimichthys crocea TaxID=215358 RepID=A0ACD3RTS7_LARCR|nr:Serine hydrolase-like protein [Larimichthys crocea]